MGKPRVLAHSWGTYLTWRALLSEPPRETDALVFAATPLAREVRWNGHRFRERVRAVHSVRLRHDAVMRPLNALTSLPGVGRLFRMLVLPADIGGAGGAPFVAQPNDIVPSEHHVVEPTADAPEAWACASCQTHTGWLHNWRFSGQHEELLTRYDHLAELVRPLLWGMMPADFRRWLEDCRALAPLARLESEVGGRAWDKLAGDVADGARSLVSQMLDTERPFWGRGATLRNELRDRLGHLPCAPGDEERLALLIAARVCAALAVEMREWRVCMDRLARGVWRPVSAGEVPDAQDIRFAIHPSCAMEEICVREVWRCGWRDAA